MDYKKYNDYELIYEVREQNEEAYNMIIKKYSMLIRKIADEYYKANKNNKVDYEDIVQEGYFGLLQALDNYKEDDKTLFYTYATICIRREMERLLKAHNRQKNLSMNKAISLYKTINHNEDATLEDVIASKDNVEEYVMSEINTKKLMDFKYELPDEMSLIYELRYNKFNNDEISILLDMPKKKVEKLVNNIKREVKKYYLRIS